MALWGSIFKPETKEAPRTQFVEPVSSQTIGRVVGWQGALGAMQTDDIARYVSQYERVLMVFRTIDAIATATSRVTLHIKTMIGPKGQVIDGDPLEHLLNIKPNSYETAFQFRYRMSSILKLSRRGVFIEVVWSTTGVPMELHILPNERVTIVGDPRRYIRGIWVDGANGRSFLDPTRFLWIREKPHPTDVYAQITPLVAAGLATDTDYLARLFNRNFLANDGRPGMIVGIRGRISPEDKAKLQARYGAGPTRAGETTVIQSDDITLADMAGSPRDAQWLEAVSGSKDDIMLALGTPESALGNASGRTFDNADAELWMWWTETNTSHLNAQCAALSAITAGGVTGRDVVEPDWDSVPVLRREKEKRQQQLMSEYQANLITVDEYRDGTGREPFNVAGSRVLLSAPGQFVRAGTPDDMKQAADQPVTKMPAPVGGAPGMADSTGAPGAALMPAQGSTGAAAPASGDPVSAVQAALAEYRRTSNNDNAARALRIASTRGPAVKELPGIETKTPSCTICGEPATHEVRSAADTYLPACDEHLARVVAMVTKHGIIKDPKVRTVETKAQVQDDVTDEMTLVKAGPSTYHVLHKGRRIGTVGKVDLPGAGKGWMAWDHGGAEHDVFGVTRYDAVSHVWRDHLGRFAHHEKALPKTQKCKYCTNQATKRVIHSEGMAYIPVCDDHLARGKRAAAHSVPGGGNDPSNVDYVREIKGVMLPFESKAVREPQDRTSAADELQGVVKSLVAQYGRQVIGRFNGTKLRKNTRYWSPPGTEPLQIVRVVDQQAAATKFRADIADAVQKVTDRLLRTMANEWGGDVDMRTLRQEVERQVVNPMTGYATDGFEKLANNLYQAMTDADIEGAKQQDMVDVIDRTVKEKGHSWAETAGKYLAGAAVEGAQGVYAMVVPDVELVKTWHTKDDDKVRPTHWAVDGETVGANDQFRVGDHLMRWPHDPTAPIGETINCRCWADYRPRRAGDAVGTPPRPRRVS